MSKKRYLGDSVYADFDGFHIVLTTENGYGASNIIHLEPGVWAALKSYVEAINQESEIEDAATDKIPSRND